MGPDPVLLSPYRKRETCAGSTDWGEHYEDGGREGNDTGKANEDPELPNARGERRQGGGRRL